MGIIVSRSLSVCQEHELLLKFEAAGLDKELAQKVIDSKGNGLAAEAVRLIRTDGLTFAAPLAEWRTLYDKAFGFNPSFSDLVIPEKQEGFARLIVVAKGVVTPHQAYVACSRYFLCGKPSYEGDYDVKLDKIVDLSFEVRSAVERPYAVWVRDSARADEELKGLSANDLAERGIPGITLTERLLYELKHYMETRAHLETLHSCTLCSGSRFKDGSVPVVDPTVLGRGLTVCIDQCDPAKSFEHRRSREVVS